LPGFSSIVDFYQTILTQNTEQISSLEIKKAFTCLSATF